MFEKLLTLPGVGPKTALGYLSAASVETLHKAISSQDVGYLTKISGIGRKSAEKIITGLKDKIDDLLISLSSQVQIIHPLPNNPSIFTYLIGDRAKSSLAMARYKATEADLQIQL